MPVSTPTAPLRHLYGTARWQRVRDRQLSEHPLCERCLVSGIVEVATVVHHVHAHKGDVVKFWNSPFESLCAPCHNRFGQLEDHGKTVILFDEQGWPI